MPLVVNSPFQSTFQRAAYTNFNPGIDSLNMNETPPPQDARVSSILAFSSEIVPMCYFQETKRHWGQTPLY